MEIDTPIEETSMVLDETVPTVEVPVIIETAPTIITISELISLQSANVAKEGIDRVSLLELISPSDEQLRSKLYAWAAAGFPATHEIGRYKVEVPTTCSDGQPRELMPYVDFCIQSSFNQKLENLQSILVGMKVECMIMDHNIIMIVVSKV